MTDERDPDYCYIHKAVEPHEPPPIVVEAEEEKSEK